METFQKVCATGALLLAVVGFIPYMYAIWRDRNKVDGVKPSMTSWFIWLSLTALTAGGMYQADALNEQIAVYAVGDALVVLMLLKWGKRDWQPLDIACLVGAAIGLGLWVVTKTPLVAICIGLGITFIGSVPTFWKTWGHPEQEPTNAWIIATATSALQALAVTELTWAKMLPPLVYLTIQTIMCVLLFLKPKRFLAAA